MSVWGAPVIPMSVFCVRKGPHSPALQYRVPWQDVLASSRLSSSKKGVVLSLYDSCLLTGGHGPLSA